MTSRQSSEGRREIEAARQRLATANAWMESAEDQKKSAEKQLKSAANSVKEAESFLKETCDRWKVIEVEDDEEDDVAANGVNGNTRKRSSVSPDLQIDPTKRPRSNNVAAVVSQDEVQQISVEGARRPEVNGTYIRCQSSDENLPTKRNDSFPVFHKSVLWQGKTVKFYIYRGSYAHWWIACAPDSFFYFASGSNSNELLPPKTGWTGSRPVPKLKW